MGKTIELPRGAAADMSWAADGRCRRSGRGRVGVVGRAGTDAEVHVAAGADQAVTAVGRPEVSDEAAAPAAPERTPSSPRARLA